MYFLFNYIIDIFPQFLIAMNYGEGLQSGGSSPPTVDRQHYLLTGL